MSAVSLAPTWRSFLATSAAAGAFGLLFVVLFAAMASLAPPATVLAAEDTAIRPFRINIPEAELTELRRRINATKWPERETVTDASQGVQLATIQSTRALLGDGIRLAQVRGETERLAAVHHRDRWAGHSFHSRSFETSRMRCRSSSRTDGPARSSSS